MHKGVKHRIFFGMRECRGDGPYRRSTLRPGRPPEGSESVLDSAAAAGMAEEGLFLKPVVIIANGDSAGRRDPQLPSETAGRDRDGTVSGGGQQRSAWKLPAEWKTGDHDTKRCISDP